MENTGSTVLNEAVLAIPVAAIGVADPVSISVGETGLQADTKMAKQTAIKRVNHFIFILPINNKLYG